MSQPPPRPAQLADFITAKRPAFGQATIPGAGEEIPQQAEEA